MRYRRFGDTEIEVSEIGVGCGGLGVGAKADLGHVLRRAVELGVNLFDTADSYAGGASEQTLGRLVADVGRDKLVLATKYGTVIHADGSGSHQDHSVGHLREALESSLRRLGTDYIDIYQVHTPRPPIFDDAELWETMDRLVEQGKIRCYGMSLDSNEYAMRFMAATRGRGLQMRFSLFFQEPRLIGEQVAARGMGVLVKVPLAGGSLTDRFGPDWPAPDDGRRRRWGEENFRRRLELLEQAGPILRANGRTVAQGALAWLLTVSPAAVPIPGISSLERLEETVAAAGQRLTPDEMAALDAIDGGALPAARFPW